jgi:hypothetical protein
MDCRTARKWIETRHNDVPSLGPDAELQAHLGDCQRCERLAFDVDQILAWLGELPEAQPEESFDWRLRLRLARIERERDARVLLGDALPSERRAPLQFAVSAAAAAVVVVALGLLVVQHGTNRTQVRPGPAPTPLVDILPERAPRGSSLFWPRPVPVRAGAPLGPEQQATLGPSILGSPESDSLRSDWDRPAASRPIMVPSPTFVSNPGSARRVP